jgi:HSP20 family protein
MNLSRWDPVRDLMKISDRLNRLATRPGWEVELTAGAWAPPVDVFERNDNLVLRVELPGVQKDDIEIHVENGVLVLRGERKRDPDLDEENAYRLERTYGAFSRSFTLPTSVDSTKIQATYKDGLLELVLPKAEGAKPKKVEIKTA